MKSLPRTYTSPRGSSSHRPRLVLTVCAVVVMFASTSIAAAQNRSPLFEDEMTEIFERLDVQEIDCPVQMNTNLLNPRCALFAQADEDELFRDSFDVTIRLAFGDRFEVISPWALQEQSYLKSLNDTESPFALLVVFVTNGTGFVAMAGVINQ